MQHFFTGISRRITRLTTCAAIAASLFCIALPAAAQSLIRDEEIERTLRTYSDPIFKASGLTPSSIRIYIVNDSAINAFVMGGSNVFINTGLITSSATPDMLLGVIAHEAGHISGGHLVRTTSEVENAQLRSMLGYLLGAAAMAGGAGDVGAAVMSANQHLTMSGLYSFTRANEQSADQSALRVLDELGISANGMQQLFEILRKQEYRKIGGDADPYMRTHPLSKERITHIRNHVAQSGIAIGKVPPGFDALHGRMLGKLEGFLDDPMRVLMRYPTSDTSVRARYARAVAYHRQIETERAIQEMDTLIASNPQDPFFHELKGQILFESGRMQEALESYQTAANILPDAALIRTELGRVLVALEDNRKLPEAIQHLEYATSADRKNPQAWRLLATAYGREDRMGQSHLALAEEALVLNKPDQALQQLEYANQYIKDGSPARLREQDLRKEALKLRKEQKKKD